MRDQLADRRQTSRRPPSADRVVVDVGAVAGDAVAEVLWVPGRQAAESVGACHADRTVIGSSGYACPGGRTGLVAVLTANGCSARAEERSGFLVVLWLGDS